MNRHPAATPDPRRAEYEQMVGESMQLHASFNELGETVAELYGSEDQDTAEQYSRERHALEAELTRRMQQRVALLRAIEHPTRLEDMVPQIRATPKVERDAAAVDRALGPGQPRARARRTLRITEPLQGLSEHDRDRFLAARVELAQRYGFDAENLDREWVTLTKNDVEFEMAHLPFPNIGISGESRIAKLFVRRLKGRSKPLLKFDGGWDTACVDREIQEEIDRIVAVFG